MARRITVDPVTRIEGHLRVDCDIDQGKVTNAWSSGQMWRGIETILKGRDPREAWLFTQRICGVCTTVHAIASVRAVENALDLEVPLNAQYIRNMVMAAHALNDHIVHFYHLSALDWVDLVSALKADPDEASKIGESLSNWPGNSRKEMAAVQTRLKTLVDSGQLGIYANGYWGHPAMKLAPEVNLLAAAHYLQALQIQRKANQIVAILGSKTPHIQNLAVGGVANPLNLNEPNTLTLTQLKHIKALIGELGQFVNEVYMVDVAAIGAFYADWTQYGAGVTNYLCVPEMPLDTKGTEFELPGGYISDGNPGTFTPIHGFNDPDFENNVSECVKHAWYKGTKPLHPYDGETDPDYTDFQDDGKYSWVKAPMFNGKPAQVGPLANVLCMAAAGHAPTLKHLDRVLSLAGSLAGTAIPVEALHSTIGRHAARAVRAGVYFEVLDNQWDLLMENIGRGDYDTCNMPVFPRGEQRGVGIHEAPRGVLSHWIVIKDGKIKNYQCVVPSTWNAGPRNEHDELGPYEASLIGNPVADADRPLEVVRTIHSFDPCLACAIHVHDPQTGRRVTVRAL